MFIKIDSAIINLDKLNFIKFEVEDATAIATLYFENGEALLVYNDNLEYLVSYFEERLCK
jgi:hypothetical protein